MDVVRKYRLAMLTLLLPVLGACSEGSFRDAFDAGNRGDDTVVATNQPLSMPPDMALRQPGAANAPAYSSPQTGNGLQVQQGQRATGTPTYQAPPPPQPSQPAWQNTAPAPAPTQQQAYNAPAAPASTGNPADQPYTRLGINPYNADGSRKEQKVLEKELRAAELAQKQASNPNYGTVFNMGELWSGN